MSLYRIYLTAEASQTVEVEAETLDEAIAYAFEENDIYENISMRFEIGDPVFRPEFSTKDGKPLEEGEAR